MLLIGGLAISTAGCLTTPKLPPKPTTPTLTVIPRDDGGVCFNRTDAAKLGNYILELENGYAR